MKNRNIYLNNDFFSKKRIYFRFPTIILRKKIFCVCTNIISGRPKKSDIYGKHFDSITKTFRS